MLQEIPKTRQIEGEPFRRWFADERFDLIVWYSTDRSIIGYQLCYRDDTDEHALTWLKASGFSHRQVDSGENRSSRHKMTPILLPDGIFSKNQILERFERNCIAINPEVAQTVIKTLKMYPDTLQSPGDN